MMKNSQSGQWWDQWLQTWQALSAPARPANPWAASLDQWSRLLSPPPHHADVFARMLAQGKSFMSIGDAISQSLNLAGRERDVVAAFIRALDTPNQDFGAGGAELPAGGLWQLPLDAWRQTVSTMSGLPPAVLQGASGATMDANWVQQQLERVLKTPSLGFTREHQGQYQELARRLLSYQEAFSAYTAAYADKGGRALQLLRERLQQREASKTAPIGTVKELFDLWVDCSEEVYAEFVMSDEYVHLHGQLTNAFMAVKQQERIILDDHLEAIGLPTRREMDTLFARFQQARRNERSLQAAVQALQARLDALQADRPASVRRPAQRKKKVRQAKKSPVPKRH